MASSVGIFEVFRQCSVAASARTFEVFRQCSLTSTAGTFEVFRHCFIATSARTFEVFRQCSVTSIVGTFEVLRRRTRTVLRAVQSTNIYIHSFGLAVIKGSTDVCPRSTRAYTICTLFRDRAVDLKTFCTCLSPALRWYTYQPLLNATC